MSSFEADVPTMDLAASHVFEVNEEVQAQLTSLLQRLEPLMSSWQGAAAASFHQLENRWFDNASKLNLALRGIGEGLVQASRNYAASEDANQQGFTGITGSLD